MTSLFSQIEGPVQAPVVMLHTSLACSHLTWDRQMAGLLAAGWRVLRYDLRGHGRSPQVEGPCTLADFGRDALDVLADHGLTHAVHVGLSLGGMIAMWLAERHRVAVDGLVLCCTSALLEPGAWHERGSLVREQGTAAIADLMATRWLTPSYATQHPQDRLLLREEILATTAGGYAAGCEAIATMDIDARLSGIGAPTLVIAGAQDPGTSPEHAQHIAEAIPGARLVVVDPGAHLLSIERPDIVTNLITTHLASIREPTPSTAPTTNANQEPS